MPHHATGLLGQQTKIVGSRPNLVIFWPFLAFEGRLRGLKDPLEVRVEDETCRTIDGTHLEGILRPKIWTGLAGGVKGGQDPAEGFRRAGTLGPLLDP